MPLFHFNLADHVRDIDNEGTELPSLEAARVEAVVFAGAYVRDNPQLVHDDAKFVVEVTDDDQKPLFKVTISAESVDHR